MAQPDFILIPYELLTNHDLTINQIRVMMALCSFRNRNTSLCNPSTDRLAERAGLRTTHLSRAIAGLERMGYLQTKRGDRNKIVGYQIDMGDSDSVLPESVKLDLPESVEVVLPESAKLQVHVNRQTTTEKKQGACAPASADESFEAVWLSYPKRAGGNNKQAALKAWKARIAQGYDPDEIIEGVGRYCRYVESEGLIGTPMVKQAATFFGPNLHFKDEYALRKQSEHKTKKQKINDAWDRVINHVEPKGDFINGNSTRVD